MEVFSLIRYKENSAPKIIGVYDTPDTACDDFAKLVKSGDVLSDDEDAERAINLMRHNNCYSAVNCSFYQIYPHHVHTKNTREFIVNIEYKMVRTVSIIADSVDDAKEKANQMFNSCEFSNDIDDDEIEGILDTFVVSEKEV